MLRRLALAAAVLLAPAFVSAADTFKIDPVHATVIYRINHLGVSNAYGRFDEPTGMDRAAFPNIDAWAKRIAALPGWAHPYDLMKRGFPQT